MCYMGRNRCVSGIVILTDIIFEYLYSYFFHVLTLSLPRVINFNFLFQSLTRDISYSMENLAIDSLLKWKLIKQSFLTTSLNHFLLEACMDGSESHVGCFPCRIHVPCANWQWMLNTRRSDYIFSSISDKEFQFYSCFCFVLCIVLLIFVSVHLPVTLYTLPGLLMSTLISLIVALCQKACH